MTETIIVGVAAVVLALGVWAVTLPATRSGSATIDIAASPSSIVAIIENVELQTEWRADIVSVDRDEGSWTEMTKSGETTRFQWLERSEDRLSLQFSSNAGYSGEWHAVIAPTAAGATVHVNEQATIRDRLRRVMAHMFFDPSKFS